MGFVNAHIVAEDGKYEVDGHDQPMQKTELESRHVTTCIRNADTGVSPWRCDEQHRKKSTDKHDREHRGQTNPHRFPSVLHRFLLTSTRTVDKCRKSRQRQWAELCPKCTVAYLPSFSPFCQPEFLERKSWVTECHQETAMRTVTNMTMIVITAACHKANLPHP